MKVHRSFIQLFLLSRKTLYTPEVREHQRIARIFSWSENTTGQRVDICLQPVKMFNFWKVGGNRRTQRNPCGREESMHNSRQTVIWAQDQIRDPGAVPMFCSSTRICANIAGEILQCNKLSNVVKSVALLVGCLCFLGSLRGKKQIKTKV